MKIAKPAADAAAFLRELTPDDPRVSVRLVFGNPAAFVAGNMFMGVYGSELFFRLAPEHLAEAGRLEGAGPFAPMKGHTMTGYVTIPRELLEDPEAAERWVGRALAFAEFLPPKKGKKRSK